MRDGGDSFARYLFIVVLLLTAVGILAWRLISLHLHWTTPPNLLVPKYAISYNIPGLRGSICSHLGGNYPLAVSAPVWDYHVDPRDVNLKRHSRASVEKIVASTLKLDPEEVHKAFWNVKSRYVPLARSTDDEVYKILSNTKKVTGLVIKEKHIRRYTQGRLAAHVMGFVSKDPTNSVGAAGIEQKYEQFLKGVPGQVQSEKDARGREIYERRTVSVPPKRGCNLFLTLDHNLQYHTEKALYDGFTNCQAKAAWAIVLDVQTGGILAMANLPNYEPERYNRYADIIRKNRAISENYEPGSVMKTITACAVLNERMVTPDTPMNTDRFQSGYYHLPGDTGHVWDPFMTVREALVHSSNIVYGKLAYDLGPTRLRAYQVAFGFGKKTGIDLPGEEIGILPVVKKWDKASQSRAGIGQFVAVTPIQLVAAYGAIGNDGRLMRPYIVEKAVDADGVTVFANTPQCVGTPVSQQTARRVRNMMLGVAKKGGTARRAAIRGYTVAGKTGTAQIPWGHGRKGYEPGAYNASFIGIVPATSPRFVVLVTYHRPKYCRTHGNDVPIFNHQGGICAAPVFSRIAGKALRYLEVEPDMPDELGEEL